MSQRKVILNAIFKDFVKSLDENQAYRKELLSRTNYQFLDNVKGLETQLKLINKSTERDFNDKWNKASKILMEGIPGKNWSGLTSVFRQALNEFVELGNKQLGIETQIGHANSILNLAISDKAIKNLFFQGRKLRPGVELPTGYEISADDYKEIAKIIALFYSFKTTLDELDEIQSRTQLIKYLKKSKTFRQGAKTVNLTTIDDITNYIKKAFGADVDKKIRAYKELAEQIAKTQVVNLKADTAVNMARYLQVRPDSISVVVEIEALNKLKGTISSSLKTVYLNMVEELINKPDSELNKEIKQGLENAILQSLDKKTVEDLALFSTASKTGMEALKDLIIDTIKTGKSIPYNSKAVLPKQSNISEVKISLPAIKLPKISAKKPVIADEQRIIKQMKAEQQQLKEQQATNLLSFHSLLNSNLVQTVKQNMGAGTRRDILNLRSGRFAESVRVERLTQSRDGIVTAYYNYMRNPYATFSQGGRQERPRSRDPKLLISKSIRQVAAQAKITRLRAILV